MGAPEACYSGHWIRKAEDEDVGFDIISSDPSEFCSHAPVLRIDLSPNAFDLWQADTSVELLYHATHPYHLCRIMKHQKIKWTEFSMVIFARLRGGMSHSRG